MNTETYKTKAGVTQFRPVMSEEEMSGLMFSARDNGLCLACGEEAYGVEPDARRRVCEGCGLAKVYGYEELMVMGLIKVS